MANERICTFMVQNADAEDYIEVRHTATAYLMIRAIDENGKEIASIDMDYEEAAAVAFALQRLVDWHGERPENVGKQ